MNIACSGNMLSLCNCNVKSWSRLYSCLPLCTISKNINFFWISQYFKESHLSKLPLLQVL